MSISDFFSLMFEKIKQLVQKDKRKAECPNCFRELSKIPGSKTKCPHCNEFMYVRTKPKGGIRVVVSKKGADKIDEEWRIIDGTQEEYLKEQKRVNKNRETLKEKIGGKEPSENDIKWGMLNEDLLKYLKTNQLGLYRYTRLDMVKILKEEEKWKKALQEYLGICYLDLNGVTNALIDEKGHLLLDDNGKPFDRPFDLEITIDLAPGILKEMRKIIDKLKMEKQEVKDFYLEFSDRLQKMTGAPISPENCFGKIEKKLWG